MCEGIAMPRVKVLYHDNCFDGAASAALFARFYAARIDGAATFTFAGKAHGPGNVYDDASFDGDVNVVVDFRYSSSPRLEWWFDHHVSGFPTPGDEAHFRANPSPHKFYDPAARSCSKYLAVTCARTFGWDWAPYTELVEWADIIDGAQFESPRAAVELAEPALKLMTWFENNHDPALKLRFIDELARRPLAEIAAEPYVKDALAPILARHARSIDVIRARAIVDRRVVYFDVYDDGLDGYNKFIPYHLFPDCRYVVSVSRSPSRTKISVGSNPWSQATRTVNIAQICERYGGGGHPVVGAASFKANEVERARQAAGEIVEELRRAAVKES
jgi:hypothetical protein